MKGENYMRREFWAVEVAYERYSGVRETVYVKAGSAASAERRALALCRNGEQERIFEMGKLGKTGFYAQSVKFMGYIW